MYINIGAINGGEKLWTKNTATGKTLSFRGIHGVCVLFAVTDRRLTAWAMVLTTDIRVSTKY